MYRPYPATADRAIPEKRPRRRSFEDGPDALVAWALRGLRARTNHSGTVPPMSFPPFPRLVVVLSPAPPLSFVVTPNGGCRRGIYTKWLSRGHQARWEPRHEPPTPPAKRATSFLPSPMRRITLQ